MTDNLDWNRQPAVGNTGNGVWVPAEQWLMENTGNGVWPPRRETTKDTGNGVCLASNERLQETETPPNLTTTTRQSSGGGQHR
jgi:hypothetical protein